MNNLSFWKEAVNWNIWFSQTLNRLSEQFPTGFIRNHQCSYKHYCFFLRIRNISCFGCYLLRAFICFRHCYTKQFLVCLFVCLLVLCPEDPHALSGTQRARETTEQGKHCGVRCAWLNAKLFFFFFCYWPQFESEHGMGDLRWALFPTPLLLKVRRRRRSISTVHAHC